MLTVKNLVKTYNVKGGAEVKALAGVSIDFPEKGMVFILGKSGSGKSTLLNVAGGLDTPDEGEIIIKGKSSKDFSPADFDGYRNTYVGFVFQEYNILDEFNVEQNIALALQLQGKKYDKEAVGKILEKVELAGMGSRKPQTLSGGQKQRVAIARALVKEPEIIMADEPTGALDSATGRDVLETLKKLSKEKLVIVVSHDREFAEAYGDRIIELRDGKVISDVSKKFRKAEQVSGNVRKIDDRTVELKGELTEEEFRSVYEMFKSTGGSMILSADQEQVDKFKKVNRITSEGSREYFAETKAEDVQTSQHDGKSTDFLKSRMPVKHAVKMGAVSLKARPFRLFLTILSSVLAFAMFGVISTMMLYDVNFTVAKAIEGTAYDSAFLSKYYHTRETSQYFSSDGGKSAPESYEREYSVMTSDSDLAEIHERTGLPVFGVMNPDGNKNLGQNEIENLDRSAVNAYYSLGAVSGFTDAGEDSILNAFGNDARLAGRYPETADEIAITEYLYELIVTSGLRTYSADGSSMLIDIGSYDDLLGQQLEIESSSYTVTGIYRTGKMDAKFDELKGTTEVSSELAREFREVYEVSIHTLVFVSDTFYEERFEGTAQRYFVNVGSYGEASLSYANDSLSESGDSRYFAYQLPEWAQQERANAKIFDFKTGEILSIDKVNGLKEDEIYISLDLLAERCATLANCYPTGNYEAESRYISTHREFGDAYARLYYHQNFRYPPFYTAEYDMNMTLKEQDISVILRALNADWETWVRSTNGQYENGGDSYGEVDKFYYRDGKSLKIVGVYDFLSSPSGICIVRESFIKENSDHYSGFTIERETKYAFTDDGKYVAAVVPLETTRNSLDRVLSLGKLAADDSYYEFECNPTYDEALSMGETFAEFLWIYLLAGLGMGIVSALFLFNYISVSIMDKQREVGILRALGARGSDVFKIFFSESAILAVICTVLAVALAIGACAAINAYLVSSIFALELLNFGFVNALILSAVAIFVAFVATILPVYLTAKKKPVESIRSL